MEKSPHFKPTQCALLLIDHQVGTTQLIKNINPDQSIRNAVTLLKAALEFNMPIVMTSSQEDHVQDRLHPSLERVAPDAFAERVQRQAGVWLTSTNTIVAELVNNRATPRGMALVPLLVADPPILPVY